MDGSLVGGKIAQFRVIPYNARYRVELPKNIHDLIDVSPETLKKLVNKDESKENKYEYHELRQCKELYRIDKVKLSLNNEEVLDSKSDNKKYAEFQDYNEESDPEEELPLASRLRSVKQMTT